MSSVGDHHSEIAELRRQLIAKDAPLAKRDEMLAARTAELAAAKNGLIEKTLEAEKLKAELAKLRREKFGASSGRTERAIDQFELALEEIEALQHGRTQAGALTWGSVRQCSLCGMSKGRTAFSGDWSGVAKFAMECKMAKKGYWVGHIDVTNPERYKDYIAANAAPLKKYGARFPVRNGACEVYGGALQGRRHVVSSSKATQQPKPVTTHRSIRRRQGFVTRPAPPIS